MKYTNHRGYINVIEIKLKNIEKIDFISNLENKESTEVLFDRYKPSVGLDLGLSVACCMGAIDEDKLREIDNIEHCIKGYPRLIKDGIKQKMIITKELSLGYLASKLQRSAIGNNSKSLFLVIVDKYQGMTCSELAEFMFTTLKCTDAINLNNNKSTQMIKNNNGKISYLNRYTENKIISNLMTVYEKPKLNLNFKKAIVTSCPCGTSIKMIYVVKKNDDILKIGEKLNTDWRAIVRLNDIDSPYVVREGQKLIYDKFNLYC